MRISDWSSDVCSSDLHSVVTTCAYCGVGCSFKAEMRGNEVVRMVPYKDGKANRGHSCVKGRFAWGYTNHRERILNPMIRDSIDQPWREVSRSEEHTSELQSLMRISYAVFCLKNKHQNKTLIFPFNYSSFILLFFLLK